MTRHPASEPKRILVKGVNWLGDAVMSLPTLASLKRMFPRARLAVLSRRWLADLYRGSPAVDEALPYDSWLSGRKAAGRWKPDLGLILPRSLSSALMLFTARVPRRVGYRGEGRDALLTQRIDREPGLLKIHRVHYYHHLLGALGEAPPADPPELRVPEAERRWAGERLAGGPWLGVNPGATYGEAKQWLPGRFVEAARRLASAGLKVAVFGGPGDAALGDRIAKESGGVSLAGRTSVLQLAAAIARCRLFLTNDTGPMHVADAVGVRVVAVFGPTDWIATPPFRAGHAIVRHDLSCSPCFKRVCPLRHHECMKSVTVDEVVRACRVAG